MCKVKQWPSWISRNGMGTCVESERGTCLIAASNNNKNCSKDQDPIRPRVQLEAARSAVDLINFPFVCYLFYRNPLMIVQETINCRPRSTFEICLAITCLLWSKEQQYHRLVIGHVCDSFEPSPTVYCSNIAARYFLSVVSLHI